MQCPNGHESATDDFCDTCGTAMDGAAPAAATPKTDPDPAPTESAESDPDTCSNCGTPRGADDVFCEVCGLDYETGKLPSAPAPPAPVEETPADPHAGGKPSGWVVVVEPDRDFFTSQEAEGVDLEFPSSATPREVTLTDKVATIGRRSDRDAWYPTIDLGHPLDDPAVSRKHAELRPTDDGWQLVDTGSTNGTSLNGELVTADTPTDIGDGDVVHLGVFTKLTLRKDAT